MKAFAKGDGFMSETDDLHNIACYTERGNCLHVDRRSESVLWKRWLLFPVFFVDLCCLEAPELGSSDGVVQTSLVTITSHHHAPRLGFTFTEANGSLQDQQRRLNYLLKPVLLGLVRSLDFNS
jgi:hypothetical protein